MPNLNRVHTSMITGLDNSSGYSGYSGQPGAASASGYSGYSGFSGVSGFSGKSGFSGDSGFSGYSGKSGFSGFRGADGDSGYSGYSGIPGNVAGSGYSGYSGFSGISGYGYSGYSGYSGISGFSGVKGDSGTGGSSGYSGYSGISGYSGAADVFTDDIVVVLSTGKTFGRYINGDIIPATGKTPNEVILLASNEPLSPIVSLSSTSTIQFNQTAINNEIFTSYTVNPSSFPVPSLVSGTLSWRRNNTGSWTTLSAGLIPSAVHVYTDTNFNTALFNYRYVVTDSAGGAGTGYVDITPTPYVAPSISLPVVALSALYSPETNTNREKGNVGSNISSGITRNSPLVPLSNYTLEFRAFTGSWSDWTSLTSIPLTGYGGSATISSYRHDNTTLSAATSIAYRALVTDTYQDYLASNANTTTTVNFNSLIFYGPISALPANSTDVRNLGSRAFANSLSNPFILNTGTAYKIFTVAMPTSNTLTQVLDLDALNLNVTSNYLLSSFGVNDYLGTPITYKVYAMTNSLPYSFSHRHQVTRS